MSKTRFLSPMVAVALLAAAPLCMADSMRCGSKLIVEGDTAGMLRNRCGEPVAISRRALLRPAVVWINGRRVHVGHGAVEVPVETWEYNFGPRRLMQRVRLEDGLVVAIDTLGYGYP
jgi:hypothetical protein